MTVLLARTVGSASVIVAILDCRTAPSRPALESPSSDRASDDRAIADVSDASSVSSKITPDDTADSAPIAKPSPSTSRRWSSLTKDPEEQHDVPHEIEPSSRRNSGHSGPPRACRPGERPAVYHHGPTCYENPGSGPPTAEFDTVLAYAALREIEERSSCYVDAGAPTNMGFADLTIRPDGRVADVWGSASFASTTGRCLSALWRCARVRPFRGTASVVFRVSRPIHVD